MGAARHDVQPHHSEVSVRSGDPDEQRLPDAAGRAHSVKSSWSLAQALSARGRSVDTMTYAPVGNSVEQLADRLVAKVEDALARHGADKVHLVGHSLGGVIIALAISNPRLIGRVNTVITLGSPFGGSPWAGVLPIFEMVRALRPGSPLLRRLASTPLPDGVRWLSVTASLDIVVPGLRSVPSHAQVETITVTASRDAF